ncbi:HNH endonuclease [Labilibaculum antarcticum]|nr:HNH endonuclease [Labilibaculum antarcticum]
MERILALRVKKEFLIQLVSLISKKDARRGLRVSAVQNGRIHQNIFSVNKFQVSVSVTNLAEFIYDNILFYPTYWKEIDESGFSKMKLKEQLFKNQGNCICPYCDSDEDLTLLNFEIDHLLPKSEFPMLYLNEKNLFPCCQACNNQHYGKGNRFLNQYYNLYKTEIGLKVHFDLKKELKISGLDNVSNDFIKLIQLETRHNKELFANKVQKLAKKIRKDLKINIKNRTYLDYEAPHYYLIKELYEKYSIEILEYGRIDNPI